MNDFYNSIELRSMGIQCGENCLIHESTILVNTEKLTLGNNVRIDGFCTISGGTSVKIGSFVHIAGYVSLFGGAGIEIGDYCSIASGSKIYSVSDDLMGRGLVGPCVSDDLRYLHKGVVIMEHHSVLAANVIMMPGSRLSKGSTVLPFSVYTNRDGHDNYNVYTGSPAVYIKDKLPQFIKLVEDTE